MGDPAIEVKLYALVEGLHEKIDAIASGQREHATAVRKYADDMLEVIDRQNRHGRKIRDARNRLAAVESHLGFPQRGGVIPPPPGLPRGGLAQAWQPRPPARSQPEWDPEDTAEHELTPEDRVRIRDLTERARKDSEFWRATRWRLVFAAAAFVAALVLTSLVTRAFSAPPAAPVAAPH